MRDANLALRFGLELCLLATFAYWGAALGGGTIPALLRAIAAPIVVAVFWGLLISPKARYRVPFAVWIALQVLLFALAAAALWWAGVPWLGVVLLAVFLVSLAVLVALGERHAG